MTRPAYVPALRFHRLTRFYDPLMERWLAAARNLAQSARADITFYQGDITRLPVVGPYERVYSMLVFHHLIPDRKEQALREVHWVLRPGGRFERLLRASFRRVNSTAAWRTVFGTIELFVCETFGHPAAAR